MDKAILSPRASLRASMVFGLKLPASQATLAIVSLTLALLFKHNFHSELSFQTFIYCLFGVVPRLSFVYYMI